MSMTLSGNGTITGLVSGGLPDGTILPADLSTGGPYWDTSGNLLIGKTSATANGGDVQVSKGITFPATQVACSDANTLDDYEEGTFTPSVTYTGGTGSGSWTYLTQSGAYVKVGRLVTFNLQIRLNSFTKGTASGTFVISGLPFTASNSSGNETNMCSIGFYAAPYVAGTTPAIFVTAGTSNITLNSSSPNAGWATISDPDSDSQYFISGSYEV